jgi:hypothetical protein
MPSLGRGYRSGSTVRKPAVGTILAVRMCPFRDEHESTLLCAWFSLLAAAFYLTYEWWRPYLSQDLDSFSCVNCIKEGKTSRCYYTRGSQQREPHSWPRTSAFYLDWRCENAGRVPAHAQSLAVLPPVPCAWAHSAKTGRPLLLTALRWLLG